VKTLNLFDSPEPAYLLERPNRFVMMVRDAAGKVLKAHCPNPGKLTEFLIPGQKLLIQRHSQKERSTACTVVAVCYKGKTIFLYSSKANSIAKELILPELYPESTIISEWSIDHSRFDFRIESDPPTLVEVKSCSLVEHQLGMFPDTATQRGSRHIEELIELAKGGYQAEILFVISHHDARSFMPNPHTDPAFCSHLHRAAGHMQLRAVSVDTTAQGCVHIVDSAVPIETETPAKLAEGNQGVYLLVMQLETAMQVPVPRIGSPLLPAGWYIYVGSAKQHLQQRIARHLRKRKQKHWHIDHATAAASLIKAFPIRTAADLECELAQDISALSSAVIHRFGSSDCSCEAHLFHFSQNPLHLRSVLEVLFRYRHVEFLRR